MVPFSFTLSEKNPSRPALSYSARFGASPNTVESLTRTLSFCLTHTHIFTHTHTDQTTPYQTIFTQDFGDTVEILYHSDTIAMLPTAGTQKAKAVPWQSKL